MEAHLRGRPGNGHFLLEPTIPDGLMAAAGAMADSTATIEFKHVSKRYDNDGAPAPLVLDGLSIAVPKGEFLAIVGPSGSGKTTLIGLINRLVMATDGQVLFEGHDVRTLDPITLRRRIGYVFQGVGLFPHMSVGENIGITPRLLRWDKTRIAARVTELLKLVRLPDDYRMRMPHELSGGQRQRIGVARALAAQPDMVLLDEPFGALDPMTREAIGRDYRDLHDRLGLTTVMITHDILEAVLLADRIAVLHRGQIVETGTPHELMTNARDQFTRDLMEMPRRHAAQLQALIDKAAP
jgi:osmoprotectant transport system ATP-binding protein